MIGKALKACEVHPDGKALLAHILGYSVPELLLYKDGPLTPKQYRLFQTGMAKLQKGVPLQYITNSQGFYGYDFYVDKRVLIPRWDSEVLIEQALKVLKGNVLDVCTGSGVLAITLKKENPALAVWGSDISRAALAVAKRNAKRLNASVCFFQSNLFQRVKGVYDGLVCNPPYIDANDMGNLSIQVRAEPKIALYGGVDGLWFYRRLATEAKAYLKAGGYLFLETGYHQGEQVMGLLQTAGWKNIRLFHDFENRPRVVCARKEG